MLRIHFVHLSTDGNYYLHQFIVIFIAVYISYVSQQEFFLWLTVYSLLELLTYSPSIGDWKLIL